MAMNGVLNILQSFKTGDSLSADLLSYPALTLKKSYLSTEMQSAYSKAQADEFS